MGFSQIVLARELTIKQIADIASQTDVVLEFFIHGALCVAFSGQCYISHAHTGRSANRGECSQACRLPYTLQDARGEVIASDKHLLSMKDNDQSDNLRALIEAGIRSFKIEGRLKDLSYVKNITAHYRQLLDGILTDLPMTGAVRCRRSSLGHSHYTFTPRPAKTFNRGATDYFVQGRKTDIGAFDSPKFTGLPIATVRALGTQHHFEVDLVQDEDEGSQEILNNGDGLSYYDDQGILNGLRVNRVEGSSVFPAEPSPGLRVGTLLYRNRDQAFERLLEKPSAERRIALHMRLHHDAASAALRLTLTDESGQQGQAEYCQPLQPARDVTRALDTLRNGLGKLGGTPFYLRQAEDLSIELDPPCFLPVATINTLRREAIAALEQARRMAWQRPPRAAAVQPPAAYPENELSYLGNVLNRRARDFYQRHGVQVIAAAYEAGEEQGEVSLMITKHCLRYSYNLCPKQVKGIRPEPMTLLNGSERLILRFDCKPCEMHVIGQRRTAHAAPRVFRIQKV